MCIPAAKPICLSPMALCVPRLKHECFAGSGARRLLSVPDSSAQIQVAVCDHFIYGFHHRPTVGPGPAGQRFGHVVAIPGVMEMEQDLGRAGNGPGADPGRPADAVAGSLPDPFSASGAPTQTALFRPRASLTTAQAIPGTSAAASAHAALSPLTMTKGTPYAPQ